MLRQRSRVSTPFPPGRQSGVGSQQPHRGFRQHPHEKRPNHEQPPLPLQLGFRNARCHTDIIGSEYHHSDELFDLIHLNICELFSEALDESHYFIMFADNLIRALFDSCFLKRSQIICAFKKFNILVKIQFNKQIKRLWFNNAGKITDKNFQILMKNDNDMLWKSTVEYNSQENDVAEWLNWTLMRMIIVILTESSDLSLTVWSELLNTAFYLKLWLLNKYLKEKILYETLYKKKLNLSHLKIIDMKT